MRCKDRGVAPGESSNGASGRNIFARQSRQGNLGLDLLQLQLWCPQTTRRRACAWRG